MLQRVNLNRLLLAILLIFVSLGSGISGFMLIEGYSAPDAFYMTVITVSTVGFGELHPLSPMGRMFVAFYILFNLVVVAYLVSVLSTFILRRAAQNFQNVPGGPGNQTF